MAAKRKKQFSIRKLIYNDKYLIICSIVAAVIIWIATSMNLSPETTKNITVPVTIDFSGTLAEQLGIEYYNSDNITVDVTISCKKYLVKDITDNDIKASLQTSMVTSTGYLSVPIVVSAAEDAEFTIESYYPTSAQGYFDVAQEISMPLELNYTNTAFTAEGYVAGDTALSQNTVLVRGPRNYISNVAKVVADVTLENGLTESQIVQLEPLPVDENGLKVDYISINTGDSENALVATIPILKVQHLPPSVTFISGPENAADFFDIEYSVKSIEVGALESSALTELNLGTVSFSDLYVGPNEFVFKANAVNGITVLDGTEEVTVTITVPDSFASKTIQINRSDIKAELLKYDVSISSLSSTRITLIGDESVIADIDKSNLSISLQALDDNDVIDESTKECKLLINVNSQDNCWIYGDYTANVSVTKK